MSAETLTLPVETLNNSLADYSLEIPENKAWGKLTKFASDCFVVEQARKRISCYYNH